MEQALLNGAVPEWAKGSGYGSGYGDDYGSKDYWAATVAYFADKWSEPQQSRLADLRQEGAVIAFWRSSSDGRACNGGSNKPVSPGTVEEIPGPLQICSRNALHGTLIPPKWKGERWWIAAFIGEVVWDDDKCGALHREIIGGAL